MAIHFECPYCKEGLRAPEKAVGKIAKCSRCNKKVIVPEKKEVLVPGKDGKPKKVGKLEPKTKHKSKRKSKPEKEVDKKITKNIESKPKKTTRDKLKKKIKHKSKKQANSKLKSKKELAEFEEKIDKKIKEKHETGNDDIVYWPRKSKQFKD